MKTILSAILLTCSLVAVRPALAQDTRKVLVVSGMPQEGEIAMAGPNVISVLSGGNLQTLMKNLAAIDPKTVKAVVSFGIAGGLDPQLNFGDTVVSTEVINDNGVVYPTDKKLSAKIYKALSRNFVRVFQGPMYGTVTTRYTAASKAALYQQSGATSVDDESEGAAAYAAANHLPLVVLRTISDPQSFSLPPLAKDAITTDGTFDFAAALASLESDPSQIGALIETGFGAVHAFGDLFHDRMIVNLGGL
jgi:adenosylhomocysteine nucleosidase